MAQVREVIEWLSKRDPEEVIALTGWWYQSDVEYNNGVALTEDEWNEIVDRHEADTPRDMNEIVSEVLNG